MCERPRKWSVGRQSAGEATVPLGTGVVQADDLDGLALALVLGGDGVE
jgi:hypothetical protein